MTSARKTRVETGRAKTARASTITIKETCLEKSIQRVIRPELNVERWSIWQPSSARTSPRSKIIIREIILENGNKQTSKVTVGYTQEGALTTFDQRVYYTLIQIWEEEGRSSGATNFSLRRLARGLKLSWGPSTHKALAKSLRRLHITPFTWEHSFYDKEADETLRTTGNAFYILSDLHIEQKERGKVIATEQARFKFGKDILRNLYAGYTKPVHLDAVLSIETDVGQLLYTHIDLRLYGKNKTKYERNTEPLFEDLGLVGTDYHKPSARKRRLESALSALVGLRISDGFIQGAALEKTADGKDYKIVITKSPLTQLSSETSGGEQKIRWMQEQSGEREGLLAELRMHGINEKKACEIVASYSPEKINNQLGALPCLDKSKIRKTLAHYLIRAIEEEYELPAEYKAQLEDLESKRRMEVQKTAITTCPFCQTLSGLRYRPQNGGRAVTSCTHNPEIENRYNAINV